MDTPDYWPDIRRFLIGVAIGGIAIGLFTLISIQPVT